MPGEDRADEAAALLWRHWREGRRLAALPEALRPATRAEGYAIQARLAARSAHPPLGWKIAATSAAGQAHIGVDGPLAGRLLAEGWHEAGSATVPFGANRMRVAEAEFAFRMARDLPPRAAPYTVAEVLDAVATLHPAIEIPDSRFADFAAVGAAQLIADNACAHQFVLGPAAAADWRARDLAAHRVRGTVAGRLQREGVGANVLGDPRAALAWLANELSRHGITLAAGQVVTTGTCLVPLPVGPGDAVFADFGPLGSVAMRFAD
ncbi:2-keto-4-pentenoate hydratase [Caldovatus aquaticus]|uniref:Fumarylacetoacetate hydrolase family protein n=1 Tax=Caldovatus aquaticus TaxID=2865671 RepID=A0ABS7F5E2_9PROT|nr:fumarylacetoacetate hydrolase family protein [Caldovatus aquaticus]MBW8270836.1 fumarylacetoacetate hydrolase family protein [Caldovatus aquaticus]